MEGPSVLETELTIERAEECDDERGAEEGDEDEDHDSDGLRLGARGDVAPAAAALVQLAFRAVVEAVAAVACKKKRDISFYFFGKRRSPKERARPGNLIRRGTRHRRRRCP